MLWKKRIVKVVVVLVVFALVLLMLMHRTEGDISCLYTTF
jgi:preprotein translocase subunit SecG